MQESTIFISCTIIKSTSDGSHVSKNLFQENNSSFWRNTLQNSSPIVNFLEFTRDVLLSSSVNEKKYYCVVPRARRFRELTNFSNYRRNVLLSTRDRKSWLDKFFFAISTGDFLCRARR